MKDLSYGKQVLRTIFLSVCIFLTWLLGPTAVTDETCQLLMSLKCQCRVYHNLPPCLPLLSPPFPIHPSTVVLFWCMCVLCFLLCPFEKMPGLHPLRRAGNWIFTAARQKRIECSGAKAIELLWDLTRFRFLPALSPWEFRSARCPVDSS